MSKYAPLKEYLHNSSKRQVVLTLEEVEKIIAVKLPSSAYNPKYSWWANEKTHPQSAAWREAGYEASVTSRLKCRIDMV